MFARRGLRAPWHGVVLGLVAVLVLSGVEALAVTAPVSAAPSTAVDPRDVPLLPESGPARAEAVTPADPGADFAPLAAGGSRFDQQRSRPVSRSLFVTEFENPDGTHTFRQSSVPLNARDSSGTWHPVDTGLTADAGRVRVNRHPLNASLAARADDAALVSVEVGDGRAWLGMEQAAGSPARVAGSRVGYAGVRPDVDLDYEVTAGSVKETIRLKRPPAAGGASWRFRLGAVGLTPVVAADGSVVFTDRTGRVPVVMPPIVTWDSSGTADRPPAMTGGRYQLDKAGDGWILTVAVDEAWLRDSKRVYPVSVDPTFSVGDEISISYKSDGFTCTNCGLNLGNPLDQGKLWRSIFRFDYTPLFGQTVVGARMDVVNQRGPAVVDRTFPTDLYSAVSFDFNGFGQHLANAPVGQVGSFSDARLTAFLKAAIDARVAGWWFMLIGAELPDVWTYKNLAITLSVDTGTAPPAAALITPADNGVVTTPTPTLSVSPVSDPDGDPVRYCFKVATGADGKSGVVVDSGCLSSPVWTVPPGVLQDGVSYTWQASTFSGITTTTPPWVGHFRVDQRIGERGPAPADSVGPVTVNLANGNVTTSASSPTFTTVGGTAGVTLTYNSQQQDTHGLRASYFNDLSHNGNIADGQQPVLVRTEPQVNVDFGAGSPFPPALGADWFVARWEGFFQPPATGTYQFAGVHDDGLKIWVNNQQVYNSGCCSAVNWTQATGIALTAGQRVPIKVELAEAAGLAYLRLFTQTTDATTVPPQIIPAGWLHTTDLPTLPRGWACRPTSMAAAPATPPRRWPTSRSC